MEKMKRNPCIEYDLWKQWRKKKWRIWTWQTVSIEYILKLFILKSTLSGALKLNTINCCIICKRFDAQCNSTCERWNKDLVADPLIIANEIFLSQWIRTMIIVFNIHEMSEPEVDDIRWRIKMIFTSSNNQIVSLQTKYPKPFNHCDIQHVQRTIIHHLLQSPSNLKHMFDCQNTSKLIKHQTSYSME